MGEAHARPPRFGDRSRVPSSGTSRSPRGERGRVKERRRYRSTSVDHEQRRQSRSAPTLASLEATLPRRDGRQKVLGGRPPGPHASLVVSLRAGAPSATKPHGARWNARRRLGRARSSLSGAPSATARNRQAGHAVGCTESAGRCRGVRLGYGRALALPEACLLRVPAIRRVAPGRGESGRVAAGRREGRQEAGGADGESSTRLPSPRGPGRSVRPPPWACVARGMLAIVEESRASAAGGHRAENESVLVQSPKADTFVCRLSCRRRTSCPRPVPTPEGTLGKLARRR